MHPYERGALDAVHALGLEKNANWLMDGVRAAGPALKRWGTQTAWPAIKAVPGKARQLWLDTVEAASSKPTNIVNHYHPPAPTPAVAEVAAKPAAVATEAAAIKPPPAPTVKPPTSPRVEPKPPVRPDPMLKGPQGGTGALAQGRGGVKIPPATGGALPTGSGSAGALPKPTGTTPLEEVSRLPNGTVTRPPLAPDPVPGVTPRPTSTATKPAVSGNPLSRPINVADELGELPMSRSPSTITHDAYTTAPQTPVSGKKYMALGAGLTAGGLGAAKGVQSYRNMRRENDELRARINAPPPQPIQPVAPVAPTAPTPAPAPAVSPVTLQLNLGDRQRQAPTEVQQQSSRQRAEAALRILGVDPDSTDLGALDAEPAAEPAVPPATRALRRNYGEE